MGVDSHQGGHLWPADTKCPSKRVVRHIESKIKTAKKSSSPFYRAVHLVKVSAV